MVTSDTQQTPYQITPRLWRDEQPGDDPRLVVSVTFVPRNASERWHDVRIRSIEVRANEQRWVPRESSVAPLSDDAFELKAIGDATLPVGARATIVVSLQTSAGDKQLELPAEIMRVG